MANTAGELAAVSLTKKIILKMINIKTWAKRSQFQYSGSITTGTIITYGSGYTQKITKEQYESLRNAFLGKIIDIGTSRDNAPAGSMGNWLQNNVTRTAMASYVGPILIKEGYALRVGKHKIKILNKI